MILRLTGKLQPISIHTIRIKVPRGACPMIYPMLFISPSPAGCTGRLRRVESFYQRRLRGLCGLSMEEHSIVRTFIEALPVYFVDNVITTGTTIVACRRTLGWGTGLAYADASTRRV